ncbi:hypothetical protein C475_01142 [Halosimplex carlsbadense 2-9-1]|uniref:DUF5658 domain-containing protein n=1 Tax=Halosimplex carlsbadense 2-9-1 TaxID=797114 RepID=M0D6H3_9EURY|nr:hypothetical protein [Halosimplex carlsbadense]ELZ30297.1 hypothetical protein C475_01142 [Halosimplex carlsbadense 2-9-1]
MIRIPLRQSLEEFISHLSEYAVHLWAITVLFYGFGDLGTTFIGVSVTGIAETGPVAGPLLRRFGFQLVVVVKLLFLAICFAFWRLVPDRVAVGIPLGLGVLGVVVVLWNVSIILTR